MIFELFTSIRT